MCQMDTNVADYLRVLNAVCRQLSHGTDAGEIEQAIHALRTMNPTHALLPSLEAKARQLKRENDVPSDMHEKPVASPRHSIE